MRVLETEAHAKESSLVPSHIEILLVRGTADGELKYFKKASACSIPDWFSRNQIMHCRVVATINIERDGLLAVCREYAAYTTHVIWRKRIVNSFKTLNTFLEVEFSEKIHGTG